MLRTAFPRTLQLFVALVLLASSLTGCGSGGSSSSGGAAARVADITGVWQITYTEQWNTCGKDLEGGTDEVVIRQNGDVIDLQISDGDIFIGFRDGMMIDLAGAQIDEDKPDYLAHMQLALELAPSGSKLTGVAMQEQMDGDFCMRQYAITATRKGALPEATLPPANVDGMHPIFATTMANECLGNGPEVGDVGMAMLDLIQNEAHADIDVLNFDAVVAHASINGDNVRVHIETLEDDGGHEIRIGTLLRGDDGVLTGLVHVLKRDIDGLCGGVEAWTTLSELADEIVGMGTTAGSVAGEDDDFTGSCWIDDLADRAYQFTAPATGLYQFDTYGSATHDTVLFLIDAEGNEFACNDQAGGTAHSELVVDLVKGETVIAVVDIYTPLVSEEFQLNIEQYMLEFAEEAIEVGITTGTVEGRADDVWSNCTQGSLSDVIYQFTAPSSNLYVFDLAGSASSSTTVSLFTQEGWELACDAGTNADQASVLHYLEQGETVYVVVDASETPSPEFQLNVFEE